jgi:uncharacterized protein
VTDVRHAAFRERYGPWALVAGASSGLGEAFAESLASRGLHVVLVARRAALLAEVAEGLRARHGVEVRCVELDLAAPELWAQLSPHIMDIEVGCFVYNAALSLIGPFLSQPIEEKLRVLDVNCRGPLVLADGLGRAMAERGRGGIVLMTSLAGSQGSPLVATYAATKAFNLVLAEGLWEELGRRGVDVLGCRAGAIRTPAYVATRPKHDPPLMEARAVAQSALRALGRKPSNVPGFVNRLGAFVMNRLLPRRAAIRLIARSTRKMYDAE